MPLPPPYTYYTCPCTDLTTSSTSLKRQDQTEDANGQTPGINGEEDRPFDPRSPRANYVLYPLDHLLFCNECHQIRCPRCYYEEVLYYYCPNCLLEAPSGSVKGESNRCTRSCFQCPICVASLQLTTFASSQQQQPSVETRENETKQSASAAGGPFILYCPYCTWSTLEIGIKFERSINIGAQLARLRNGGELIPDNSESNDAGISQPNRSSSILSEFTHRQQNRSSLAREMTADMVSTSSDGDTIGQTVDPKPQPTIQPHEQFTSLLSFYKNELLEHSQAGSSGSGPVDGGFGASSGGIDSPSHLARILSTYGVGGLRKQRGKPVPMREAGSEEQGLLVDQNVPVVLDEEEQEDSGREEAEVGAAESSNNKDSTMISRLSQSTWSGTTSSTQRLHRSLISNPPASAYANHELNADDSFSARFPSTLRPIPTPLRSKRAKRCSDCRNNIVRPDEKRHSTRYKLRLVAANNIPRIGVKPLSSDFVGLEPGKTCHFVLTLRNPIFEAVRVTLATPQTVSPDNASRTRSGEKGSASVIGQAGKVTILCPQFEIGAAADVWDEALDGTDSQSSKGSSQDALKVLDGKNAQPEAGKPFTKGRNWTSVVLEVTLPTSTSISMPGQFSPEQKGKKAISAEDGDDSDDYSDLDLDVASPARQGLVDRRRRHENSRSTAMEDENKPLEIPMLVRMEYDTDETAEGGMARNTGSGTSKDKKTKRELQFWVLLGLGNTVPPQ